MQNITYNLIATTHTNTIIPRDMDALANYGSDDSDSSADNNGYGKGISGLLGHYSDSDNDEAAGSNYDNDNKKVEVKKGDDNNTKVDEGQPNKKKRRRWDNPKIDDATNIDVDINSVLPTPKLSSADKYQSLTIFNKDYTTNLRQKLAQQLQSQTREWGTVVSAEKQQLNNKLEQLYEKFQQNESSSTTSSFATHIKNQQDFGNPHLLKSVIDHYELKGLGSNVGNSFKSFEQIDRLQVAEEKSRIAQANNFDPQR